MQHASPKLWLVKDGTIGVDSHGLPLHHHLDVADCVHLPLTVCDDLEYVVLVDEAAHVNDVTWSPLRECLLNFGEAQFLRASQAVQLHHWFTSHRYCGRCAEPLGQPKAEDLQRKEMVLRCGACNFSYYPRISPCIIVLVTRGQTCLLAKHRRSKTGVYTTLAGFIEAGETPEQAIVREVKEEVGISVDQLSYQSSQSWPFPGQLMLGYDAEYSSGEFCLQEDEIAEADWFDVRRLPKIPPRGTIARRLIDGFVERCIEDDEPAKEDVIRGV